MLKMIDMTTGKLTKQEQKMWKLIETGDSDKIGDISLCLDCSKPFHQDRDIQLCDKCMCHYNVDKLWKLHDARKLDALDFNESEQMRERFRKKMYA